MTDACLEKVNCHKQACKGGIDDGSIIPEYSMLIAYFESEEHGVLKLDLAGVTADIH